MKIKLSSGVILESENPEVFNGWLNNGGTEVTEVASEKPKRQYNKKEKSDNE